MRVTSLLVALAGCTTVAMSSPFKRWDPPIPGLSLSQNEQDIFDYSMQVQDWSWEPWLGWIQANDDKGHTSTRFTAWYIVGLLHRNKGDDVQRAITAIRNVISLQFTDPADNGTAWYWDYKVAADIPDPNDETFPPAIYTSYDPNWSFFVGSAFVQAISEFEHLLPTDVVESMVDSTYKAARHLMTRVGYDGDNLVTAYSNPAIGRALIVEWVGHRLNDQNLTDAGNQYAQDVYDLFTADGHNTLGEYNSPTYYGIDVLELLQWIRHAPPDSKLPGHGSYILRELWADIGEHYNYNLKNMVGPYDRVYHRNFLYDDSIVTIWFWMLLGRERAPVASLGLLGTQFDLRQGACMALLGQTLRSELNSSIVDRLTEPVGSQDRIILRGIRDSLDNDTTRINTAWMSENVMAGGQQVAEEYNRGNQFAPMIAHWKSGETSVPDRTYVSFFQLFPTASTINATVTPNRISISYPNTTQAGTDVFQFLIGDIPGPYYSSGQMMKGFDNLPCLDVAVTSQGLNGTVKLGKYLDLNIQSNNFWTVDYYVNSTYEGTPSIDMDLKYTC